MRPAAVAAPRSPRLLTARSPLIMQGITIKRAHRYHKSAKTTVLSSNGASSAEIDDDGDRAKPSSSLLLPQNDGGGHRDRLPLRLGAAWYFLGGASGALLFPYLPVFLADRGLSAAQIGLVSALRPWIAAPAGLAAAALADARSAHRPLLLVSLIASAALRASLPWIGGGGGGSDASASASAAMMLSALLAAEALSFAGVLGDATVLSNLGPQGAQQSFGALRVWASVGFGVFGLAGGAAIAAFGLQAPFVGFGALSALMVIVGAGMRYNYDAGGGGSGGGGGGGGNDKQVVAAAAAGAGDTTSQGVWAAVARPDAAVFLFQAVMLGAGMGMHQTAAFLYLQSLGGGPQLMGLCIAAMTASEVPAFALQRPLLARFGVDAAIDAALFALGARLLLYAAAPPALGAWCAPLIDASHGLTFAAAWAACTARAAELAPPRGGATLQGIMQAAFLGAGVGVGGLAGGALVESGGGGAAGGARAFAVAGTALLLAAAGAIVARRLVAAGGAEQQQQDELQNK